MTDLTITEINTRLSALVVAMLAKGIVNPYAEYDVKSDQSDCIFVRSSSEIFDGDGYKFFYAPSPLEILDKADAYIAALPDPAKTKLQNHMRRVADCIDKGREDGIDDAYIAPLVVVKEAMTENLLTAQVSA